MSNSKSSDSLFPLLGSLCILLSFACAPSSPSGDDAPASTGSEGSGAEGSGSEGSIDVCVFEPPDDPHVAVRCDLELSRTECSVAGGEVRLVELLEEPSWIDGPAWSVELAIDVGGPAPVWKTLEVRPNGGGGTLWIYDLAEDEPPYVGDYTMDELGPRLSHCAGADSEVERLSCSFWAAAIASVDRC